MRPTSATKVASEENLQLPGQTTPDETVEPSRTRPASSGNESRTAGHDPDDNPALSDTVSQAGSNEASHLNV